MRIEVLVGSDDPVIYPLNSPKISVGSSENCEVVVNADGVSRKHLTIFVEQDQFFVADQGSTNGSFMNEERLVPGRKVEFTSFFPVRLGAYVLITLLSDDEGPISIPFPITPKKESTSSNTNYSSSKSSETRVLNFSDGKNSDPLRLRLQKNEIRKKTKSAIPSPKPRGKSKFKFIPTLAVLIMLVAGYYNFFVLDSSITDGSPTSKVRKIKKITTITKNSEQKANPDLVSSADAPKKELFLNLMNDLKCMTDGEAYLCNLIPGANQPSYGVVQTGLTYIVYINAEKYVSEVRPYLRQPELDKPDSEMNYQNILFTAVAYVFLYKYMPLIDETKIGPDSRVAIGFFTPSEEEAKLEKILVFYPNIFNIEKPKFSQAPLLYFKKAGPNVFNDFQKKFLVY